MFDFFCLDFDCIFVVQKGDNVSEFFVGYSEVLIGKIGYLKLGKFYEDFNIIQVFIGIDGMQIVVDCLVFNVNVQ